MVGCQGNGREGGWLDEDNRGRGWARVLGEEQVAHKILDLRSRVPVHMRTYAYVSVRVCASTCAVYVLGSKTHPCACTSVCVLMCECK